MLLEQLKDLKRIRIIHRDIRPANVLFRTNYNPNLLNSDKVIYLLTFSFTNWLIFHLQEFMKETIKITKIKKMMI